MKYLKLLIIIMGLLIFFGTATIIYIVFERVNSNEKNILFKENIIKNFELEIGKNSEIINTNISDDKLILTTKLLDDRYRIIVFDLKTGKQLYFFDINQ